MLSSARDIRQFSITNREKETENFGKAISSDENGSETQNEKYENLNSNQLNSNNQSDTLLDQTPRPYLHRYYKFARNKGKSLKFICMLCKPKNKQISAQIKDRFLP